MVRVLPKWGVFENCHYEYRKKADGSTDVDVLLSAPIAAIPS